MTTSKIIRHSLINAVLASGYVAMVAQIMRSGETVFDGMNNAYAPIAFLLLFVVSAAVMTILIFGQPVIWYLDGFKKQGIRLAIYTVALLFIITYIFLISLVIR